MSRRPLMTGLLVAALAVASVAHGAELNHSVRPGEYATLIAKYYYGNVESGELLLLYNGKDGTVIHPGDTMRVPYCDVHRVRSGDTWSALAARYLERASAYPTIATLNRLEPGRALQLGQEIAMPVVFEYELARGETLAALAERFYGDAQMATVLAGFNDIDDPRRLSVGTTVEVPIVSLRLVENKPPPIAKQSQTPKPAAESKPTQVATKQTVSATKREPAPELARFEAEILQARQAFELAEFDTARTYLERVRNDVEQQGSTAERAELWRLLAFVNIALDETVKACAAYDSLTTLDPATTDLDPDLVSPKIRRTLGDCQAGSP